jgi:hypothetical protein
MALGTAKWLPPTPNPILGDIPPSHTHIGQGKRQHSITDKQEIQFRAIASTCYVPILIEYDAVSSSEISQDRPQSNRFLSFSGIFQRNLPLPSSEQQTSLLLQELPEKSPATILRATDFSPSVEEAVASVYGCSSVTAEAATCRTLLSDYLGDYAPSTENFFLHVPF